MAASQPPRDWPPEFEHAAHAAEDALVAHEVALETERDGAPIFALPDRTNPPSDPARRKVRLRQRARLAELLASAELPLE
jgi:hypothetical protein